MVKNECDIIELFIRINSRWATHFHIVDDLSADATIDILRKLQQEGHPITLYPNDFGSEQSQVMTAITRKVARLDQYDFIFPIDADEFVNDPALLFSELNNLPDGIIGRLEWATMVPLSPYYFSFPAPLYQNFRRRKKELRQFSKVILPNEIARKCVVQVGNHTASLDGKTLEMVKLEVELAHVPVRSKEQIMLKALNGSHRKSLKPDRAVGESFHFDLMADRLRSNGFILSDADFFSFAADYSQLPEDGICRETVNYALGWETDRMLYGTMASINVQKGLDHLLSFFAADIKTQRREIAALQTDIDQRDAHIARLDAKVTEIERRYRQVINSRSWRLTRALRFSGRLARGEFATALIGLKGMQARYGAILRRARNALRYVGRGDFGGLIERVRAYRREEAAGADFSGFRKPLEQTHWGVMATRHTLFIAQLIAERLRSHGSEVDILTEAPAGFPHDLYVVICPQIFRKLPPGEKRIAYQMEQSVSSRWFTRQYFDILKNSLAVLEYSLVNVDFLARKAIAYPHVHYLPVGATPNYGITNPHAEKCCDVLFYGDSNSSPRRQRMLAELKQRFDVRVVNEVFGEDMIAAIRQAKVVINLHYYENALLEMPRIQECLSLGVPVVSESSQDQGDYPELDGAVRFFEQGSIAAMLEAVDLALRQPCSTPTIEDAVRKGGRRFDFMFDRFLMAVGLLPAAHVHDISPPLPDSANRIALSLPETISRRMVFESERPDNCVVFDGIRKRPGWVGCGLSYQALALHALRQGRSRLTVMEDDVLLPSDLETKLAVINEYLDANSGNWDLFAGVIAQLHPQAEIITVERFKSMTFVTLNKMTSTVFNIYGERALRLLASWNPEHRDAESNTIDRYLENQADLRVVVTCPFLVGHREEVHSTIWGFQNTQYIDMIQASEQRIARMVDEFCSLTLAA